MDKLKGIAIAGAATVVVIGGIIYTQIDNWASDEPTGPGSGDEIIEGSVHDDYIYENTPGSGDELPPDNQNSDEPTGPGSGDELNWVASCNVISAKSTCVEYTGSYWQTPQVAALNCQGVGAYSETACPRPTSGGCMTSGGTTWEMVTWFYPYGGDPVTGENITYAAGACNGAGGQYIFDN